MFVSRSFYHREMLIVAVQPPEIQNFWVPVATIVPVFALAMVLEGRRQARNWKVDRRKYRMLQAGLLGIAGAALLVVEAMALSSMRNATTEEVQELIAYYTLTTVFAIVVTMPLSQVVASGYVDMGLWLARVAPFSSWRRGKRRLRKLRRSMEENLAAIEVGRTELKTSRAQLQAAHQAVPKYLEDAQRYLSRQSPEGTSGEQELQAEEYRKHLREWVEAVPRVDAEIVEAEASLADALRENKRMRRSGRKLLRELEKIERETDESLFSDENKAMMQEWIDDEARP